MIGPDSLEGSALTVTKACEEFSRRLRAGEDCRAEEFLDAASATAAEPDEILDLLYTEFVVREQLGQHGAAADLLTRFPQWRDELEQLFEIHAMVEVRETCSAIQTERTPVDVGRPLRANQSGEPSVGAVGGYDLLREIGRGGMGVVYQARQRGLDRVVALKMILPPHGERERARFRAEAEATARLSHPNIVPIYEVNQDGDCPFLAMEYVAGQRLDKRLADAVLAPEEAASLLKTLAEAVGYAHAQGIIHRDLKPANILLQDRAGAAAESSRPAAGGESAVVGNHHRLIPRITDFGLAKTITDESLSQASIAIAGTPSYMAPEQCSPGASVGPAADIYSLGAILYEALTGRPPFRGQSVLDIVDLVRSQDPVAPSRLAAHVPRDLETICLKCLAKLPEQRYLSAAALADDLQRYLDDRPILARPVGRGERMFRWCRRNPVVASLATGIVLVLVAGSLVSTTLAVWAVNEKNRANSNAAKELAARQLVDRHLEQAEQAVAKYLDGIEKQVQLKEADFSHLRRELLTSAIPFYEDFVASRPGDADLEARQGRAYGRLGFIHRHTGELERATADYERMRDIFERLHSEGHDVLFDLGAAHHELGITLASRTLNPEAGEEYELALAIKRQLTTQFPRDAVHRHRLAIVLKDSGSLQLALNQNATAAALFTEALDLLETLGREHPTVIRYRQDAAGLHNFYGVALEESDPDTAEMHLRLAVSLSSDVVKAEPRPPNHRLALATAYQNLAWFLSKAGRNDAARVEVENSLKLRKQLAAEFPDVPSYRKYLAVDYRNLGLVMRIGNDLENSLEVLHTAVTLLSRLTEDFPATPDYRQELARSLEERALVSLNLGDAAASERDIRAAAPLRQKLADDFPQNADHRDALAKCRLALFSRLVDAKRYSEAEVEVRAVIDLRKALFAESPGDLENVKLLAVSLHNLATTFKVTNRRPEAIAVYDETLPLWTDILLKSLKTPAEISEAARSIYLFAMLCRQSGELDKAKRLVSLAAEHQLRAVRSDPDNEQYLGFLRDDYFEIAEVGRLQSDHVSTALAADQLGAVRPDSGDDSHWAARYFGRCMQFARLDQHLAEDAREALANSYAERAMQHLHEAVRRGYRDAAALRKLAALSPLRERPDFQTLVSELETTPDPPQPGVPSREARPVPCSAGCQWQQ